MNEWIEQITNSSRWQLNFGSSDRIDTNGHLEINSTVRICGGTGTMARDRFLIPVRAVANSLVAVFMSRVGALSGFFRTNKHLLNYAWHNHTR
mmetsp:Transcript_2483/g.4495  ORF Transcript_2483/g.4495 Transcript_2483/m.4495 type:complete len:93 (+) Transcript_2483:52-330(+)